MYESFFHPKLPAVFKIKWNKSTNVSMGVCPRYQNDKDLSAKLCR
ncbi:MAG: hypothetical protein ACI39N_07550 [Lachnospiraceae bacterium]